MRTTEYNKMRICYEISNNYLAILTKKPQTRLSLAIIVPIFKKVHLNFLNSLFSVICKLYVEL